MDDAEHKAELHRYLQVAREALLWKLDGLSEYEVRRPMVRTGTNLLGLVKHLAGVEAGYFGHCFDRPLENPPRWMEEDGEANADMWATAEESRDEIIDLYRRVWAHADATIESLDLDTTGEVPWWPKERRHPSLRLLLVHVVTETNRHVGHADIVRELLDGSIGHRPGVSNLPRRDDDWWEAYRDRLEQVAREFDAS